MKKLFSGIILILALSCGDDLDNGVPCDGQHSTRIGAKCMDGSTSTATGSGACSSHGGVDYWICK